MSFTRKLRRTRLEPSRDRLLAPGRSLHQGSFDDPSMLQLALDLQAFQSLDEYVSQFADVVPSLPTPSSVARGVISGYCACCSRLSVFDIPTLQTGDPIRPEDVNWREELVCRSCHLNSRVRFALAVLQSVSVLAPDKRLYVTEQLGWTYAWLRARFPGVVGSEFTPYEELRAALLADVDGSSAECVRFEDVTALSFPDASFDAILSFDVLEHVPDYRAALAEFRRTLREGGTLLLTAPFIDRSAQTLVRAQVAADGRIDHLMTPEYHGDPLNDAGCLCYYHFGWDLLDELTSAGFRGASVLAGSSVALGHVGPLNLFHASG